MQNNISFVSTVEGLEEIEECRPRPASQFIPKWFKDIDKDIVGTIKSCPAIPDFFSLGYILPMWCDTRLNYDQATDRYKWEAGNSIFHIDTHARSQFLDFFTPKIFNNEVTFVFKTLSPWRVFTPPGWSIIQLPVFYNFNPGWTLMSGIIDTDIHSEINHQILYHNKGEDVIIKRGEPFAMYIPIFRKNKLKLNVRGINEEDKRIIRRQEINYASQFHFQKTYRKLQRERDSVKPSFLSKIFKKCPFS